ncbi:MAG: trypsin-like peptidase domain-containing protein [Bacteroidota bacterium]|nr:trypsin-like peptidase domain-containing protein [Bacteroidota bacterium]
MKNIASFIFAGILGGGIVLGGEYYLNDRAAPIVDKGGFGVQVNEQTFPVTAGPDFSIAAEKALQVVVEINAQESDAVVKRKQDEYFKQNPHFNHPFFQQFEQFMPQKGSGSGVIYSPDGYIITNNHVVEFADDIEVILKDGRKLNAKKIGTDPRTDLAVLKIEATGLPVLEQANSDLIKVGEWVLAVGNPFGYLTSTVTAGIISAKGRDLNIIDDNMQREQYQKNPYQGQNVPKQNLGIEEFLQTDAAVNPGNSGGALVDASGRLVGINSAIASKTGYYAGYSFAIPINLIRKIVKELINNGSFERGRLGIGIVEIDDEIMKSMKLNSKKGVLIDRLEENSSAKYAGLIPNDIIIGINGKEVNTPMELINVVGLTKVGETLNIKIIRDGMEKEIPVRIRKNI